MDLLLPDGASIVEILPPQPASADLAVDKVIDELTLCSLDSGSTVCTFKVSVTNNGPDEATNVVLNDILSAGVISSSSSTDDGVFLFEGNVGQWRIGTIPVFQQLGDEVTLTVDASAFGEVSPYTHTAEILSPTDQFDPISSNDSVIDEKTLP